MNYSTDNALRIYDKNMIKELIDLMVIKKRITNEEAMDILVKYKVCTRRLQSLSASVNYRSYNNPPSYQLRISKRGNYNFININFNVNEIPEIMQQINQTT